MRRLRLLLDQMLDETVARTLRDFGHDVVRVSEVGLASADDAQILRHAVWSDRLLLTLDEHFGDWTVLPLSNHPGVIRIKANPSTTECVLAVLIPFLRQSCDCDFRDRLAIVRSTAVRWVWTGGSLPESSTGPD